MKSDRNPIYSQSQFFASVRKTDGDNKTSLSRDQEWSQSRIEIGKAYEGNVPTDNPNNKRWTMKERGT